MIMGEAGIPYFTEADLRVWRARLGILQAEAAARFGVSPQVYSYWERGQWPRDLSVRLFHLMEQDRLAPKRALAQARGEAKAAKAAAREAAKAAREASREAKRFEGLADWRLAPSLDAPRLDKAGWRAVHVGSTLYAPRVNEAGQLQWRRYEKTGRDNADRKEWLDLV